MWKVGYIIFKSRVNDGLINDFRSNFINPTIDKSNHTFTSPEPGIHKNKKCDKLNIDEIKPDSFCIIVYNLWDTCDVWSHEKKT